MNKIDIKNSYIKNDKGPLRESMYNETINQGMGATYNSEVYSGDYCFILGG